LETESLRPDGSDTLKLWVDYDLRSAQDRAEETGKTFKFRSENFANLDGGNLERAAAFVADIARSEQERETNLNSRGATVATVAGLLVSVSGAVAKSVFGLEDWSDWTKIAGVALFLLSLIAVATSMAASVYFVLRPSRGARTKNFMGETVANLWLGRRANAVIGADRHALDLLVIQSSMRTLPGWHFRNRAKARWLRRSWMLLALGMVSIAISAIFVLARVLQLTPPDANGPADRLNWGWLLVMVAASAALVWAAIRFDWLQAARGEKPQYTVPDEIAEIAHRMGQSPIAEQDKLRPESPDRRRRKYSRSRGRAAAR
jgi:hypothetical protein